MSNDAFEKLVNEYEKIVSLMPDDRDFDSHDFIQKLTQNNQQLYIQALSEVGGAQPFQTVHGELAKRLKKRDDLVKQNGNRSSKNIFGLENEVAVWRRVKK